MSLSSFPPACRLVSRTNSSNYSISFRLLCSRLAALLFFAVFKESLLLAFECVQEFFFTALAHVAFLKNLLPFPRCHRLWSFVGWLTRLVSFVVLQSLDEC